MPAIRILLLLLFLNIAVSARPAFAEAEQDAAVTHAYNLLLDGKESEFRAEISALCGKGNVKAEKLYGMYLRSKKEYHEAERWLAAASNAHDPEAQYQLGILLLSINPSRKGEGKKWLESATQLGSLKAAGILKLIASPPREKGNLINVSDFIQGMVAVGNMQMENAPDEFFECFKIPRATFVPFYEKILDQCAQKTNGKFGEWYEVNPLGIYFTTCLSEIKYPGQHAVGNEMKACFKNLKL